MFDDGTIQAIIAQDPYKMGYEGVAAIHAFITGQPIPNKSVELAPVLITPENINSPEVQALLQTPGQVREIGVTNSHNKPGRDRVRAFFFPNDVIRLGDRSIADGHEWFSV